LSPEPLERLPQFKLSQQDELRRRLHGLGYALEVHTDPRLHDQPISKALEETIRLSGAGCWVLNMTTAVVQRWFSERGVPSVVAGTRHAGVKLPSIDWDYRAVSRHAAGMFLRMGHRRVALLVPRSSLGGDEISRAGFLEAFQESGTTGVESRVVTHNGTVRGICSALDGLFSSETPPTGLYLFSAHSVLTTISHLIQRNIRVPRDVSVISRHDDAFLHELTPSIAAYEFPITRYAARLSQMAVRVAKVGSTSMRHVLLMGEFRNGESLARVP
jgi:DNA-binding LacI/PurR family transcriptional regulator